MSARQRAGERARAADPVRNPFLRDPLAGAEQASLVAVLNAATGKARQAAEVERGYAQRAALDKDDRGATSHDLLAQTHDAYANALAAFARQAYDEMRVQDQRQDGGER